MTTLKKIILFLFGIILVVFGNRAAINTVFGAKSDNKDAEPTSTTSPESKPSEATPTSSTPDKIVDPAPSKSEAKSNDKYKKAEKKDDKTPEVKATTTIEPAKTEEATATQ